jgi:hypothetical protein
MSKNGKQATVYVLTHAADWAINHNGKKHNLPWWQVELLKIGATALICAMI